MSVEPAEANLIASGGNATCAEDVQDYMAWWYVRFRRTQWSWSRNGPVQHRPDKEHWEAWTERELEAGRLDAQEVGVDYDVDYTFTDAWFAEAAPYIMRYRLLFGK